MPQEKPGEKRSEKLVRNKIPDIIRAHGEVCSVRVPRSLKEKRSFADRKLVEEVEEYLAERKKTGKNYSREKVLEELSDIQELIKYLASLEGFSFRDLLVSTQAKRKERGSFVESYILTTDSKK